jgi:hypothetical protein
LASRSNHQSCEPWLNIDLASTSLLSFRNRRITCSRSALSFTGSYADPLRCSTSPIRRRGPKRAVPRPLEMEERAGVIHGTRRAPCQRRRIQSSTRETSPVATITLERVSGTDLFR